MSNNKTDNIKKQKKVFNGIYYKDTYLEFGDFTGDKSLKVAGKVFSTIIKNYEGGLEKCSNKEIKFGIKNNKSGNIKYYSGVKTLSDKPTEFVPLKASRDENGKVKVDENGKVIKEPIMIIDKETGDKKRKKNCL